MLDAATREALIKRYEDGPRILREALAAVPSEAMKWRPAPGKWSVHEVICHCADSETNSASRIRYLVGEPRPTIIGYDQDAWAREFDYHGQSLELALTQIESVRAWTAAFIRRLPEHEWNATGTHSEMPDVPYSAETWLAIYAEHLEIHARQIRRNVEAWKKKS